MKTLFFGHACLKLEGDAGGVLMDPWFSRDGAFYRSWFQFPENWPLQGRALQGTRAICVSHNHADHLDPSLIARACAADPALRVNVPRYATGFLLARVAKTMGPFADRFVERPAWTPFEAAGASLFFVPEEAPGAVDSAIAARLPDGRTLVNLNDSRLSSDQLRRLRAKLGRVDLLALQCSGASEYPVCYSYPPEKMRDLARRKRADKFAHCREIIALLDPARILLFAGPPAFLDPALAALDLPGDDSVFPDQLQSLRHFATAAPEIAARAYLAVPGEVLDDTLLYERADLSQPRLDPYARKADYLRAYAARRADLPPFDWGTAPDEKALRAYFSRMPALSRYISDSIGGSVEFLARGADGSETAWTVDFSARAARPGRDPKALYALTFPASCLPDLISGRATWDDLFLSLRMRFDERTDRFVVHLKTLLRYMDPALFSAVETYERAMHGESVETFELSSPTGRYEVQRLCPHAGSDLERHGRVDADGTITCLAHRFCFDLESGECRNARGYRLKTRRL